MSVGVVIPTLNSMAYLPQHIAAIAEWVEMVDQVVVVDSESQDGTPDYIRSHLKHPKLQLFSRPRGLYQAWNFGIAQITAKYTYIATVGDVASRDGIEHLQSVSEALKSDVVISPPKFLDADGKPTSASCWPVHRFLERSKTPEPRLLSRQEIVMAALTNGLESFLGSSASNLYRTEVLQKSPFPSDYDMMGDTAWGITNCTTINVAVTPKACASFVFHPKEREPNYSALAPKIVRLASDMKNKLSGDLMACGIPDLDAACEHLAEAALSAGYQHQINEARRQGSSFSSNIKAFIARMKRNRHRARMRELQQRFTAPSLFAAE